MHNTFSFVLTLWFIGQKRPSLINPIFPKNLTHTLSVSTPSLCAGTCFSLSNFFSLLKHHKQTHFSFFSLSPMSLFSLPLMYFTILSNSYIFFFFSFSFCLPPLLIFVVYLILIFISLISSSFSLEKPKEEWKYEREKSGRDEERKMRERGKRKKNGRYEK